MGGVRAGVGGGEKGLCSTSNYRGSCEVLSTLVPASKPRPAYKEHPGPYGINALNREKLLRVPASYSSAIEQDLTDFVEKICYY